MTQTISDIYRRKIKAYVWTEIYTHIIIATLIVEKEEQEEEIREINVITFYTKPFFLALNQLKFGRQLYFGSRI